MDGGLVKDISNGKETIPISVDISMSEDLPPQFNYIVNCVSGPGVLLPDEPFYPGCDCKDNKCRVDENCSCVAKYGPIYERKNGLLLKTNSRQSDGYSQPVFECNTLCSCSKFCGNRLVQNGITTRLQVFKTVEKGWGLRTLDKIQKGHFVCEYAGEVISYEDAKKRTQTQNDNNYIIVIKEHVSGNQILRTHVDPKYYGNVGRFLNHSCDPNLVMVPVRVNSLIPILALFSLKEVQEGSELTFDYSGRVNSSERKTSDESNCVNGTRICHCKSTKCLGNLPSDSSLF